MRIETELKYDFDDVDSFLSWVSVDRAFFASVPSSGIDFNSVSITWFVKNYHGICNP